MNNITKNGNGNGNMPPTSSKEEEEEEEEEEEVKAATVDDSVSTNSDCDRVQGEEWLFGVNFSTITSQDLEGGGEEGTGAGAPTSQVDQDNSNNDIHHVVADGVAADSQHESKLSLHIQNLMNMTDEPFHPSHNNNNNNNCRDTLLGDSECNGADGDTDDCTRQLNQLWNLATKLGARLESLSVTTDKHGGKCLVSLIDIPKGDIVAILPRRLRIGQTTSTKQLGLPSKTPDLTALSLLLLDLMYKLRTDPRPRSSSVSSSSSSSVLITDEDKLLYCYASCLPHKCHNGLFMTPREQEYWSQFGPDDYHSAICRFQDQGKACVNYILHHFIYNKSPNDEEDEFQPTPTIPYTVPGLQDDDDDDNSDINLIWWAISMVQSRTHGFGQLKSRWMTPIFDFCNHSPHPNCVLQGDANGDIILRSLEAIPKGRDVTIDYQVTDDAKLVACYGFSLIHPTPPANDA